MKEHLARVGLESQHGGSKRKDEYSLMRMEHAEELRTAELLGRLALRFVVIEMAAKNTKLLRMIPRLLSRWRVSAINGRDAGELLRREVLAHKEIAKEAREEAKRWKQYATEVTTTNKIDTIHATEVTVTADSNAFRGPFLG